jgi:hypothetical protein
MPWTHQNAVHDPQIPLDVKTQVQRNVSQRGFYGNSSGPTSALKMERRRFTPQTHWSALRDPQIQLKAKTQVRRNMSQRAFSRNRIGPT